MCPFVPIAKKFAVALQVFSRCRHRFRCKTDIGKWLLPPTSGPYLADFLAKLSALLGCCWEHVHQWTSEEIRRAVREREGHRLQVLEALLSVRVCAAVVLVRCEAKHNAEATREAVRVCNFVRDVSHITTLNAARCAFFFF